MSLVLVASAACEETPPAQSPDVAGLELDEYRLAAKTACDSGNTTDIQDRSLETPGFLCSRFADAVVEKAHELSVRYYKRGCEAYADGDSCVRWASLYIPHLNSSEGRDANNQITEEHTFLADENTSQDVTAEEWRQKVLGQYGVPMLLSVRVRLGELCRRGGLESYKYQPKTAEICAFAGTAFTLFEPVDKELAVTFYLRACEHGDTSSCTASRGLGAPISAQEEDAAEARADRRREAADERYKSDRAAARREQAQAEATAEARSNAESEAFTRALSAAIQSNFGGGGGSIGTARPEGPAVPPTTGNQPTPSGSANPTPASGVHCDPGEHVCPPGYAGARVCCPNQ